MHVQIVTFGLEGISREDYEKLCGELAPSFAGVAGLVSKLWLANSVDNSFGGVYLWESQGTMEDFARTQLFQSVATHPQLASITSRDFAILETPTRVTRGLA